MRHDDGSVGKHDVAGIVQSGQRGVDLAERSAERVSQLPVRGRGARGGEGAVHRKAYVLVIHPCVRGGAA